MLTQSELKHLLHYNPNTGIFIWINPHCKKIKAGNIAGCVMNKGAIFITYKGKKYLAHRLAWLYMTRSFPIKFIDHIDGNPANNIFSNLREATHQQNLYNQKRQKNNISGYKGVSHAYNGKFTSRIYCEKQMIHLGTFNTAKEAHKAYCDAAHKYHGDFARVA